jgi:alpha-L-rhamnosidase
MIKSDWKVKDNDFDWSIAIPANTTAEIYIPAKSAGQVTEGGKKTDDATAVKFIRMDGNYAVLEIGSGNYHFVSKEFK